MNGFPVVTGRAKIKAISEKQYARRGQAKRTKTISFKLTQAQYDFIGEYAENEKTTVSAVLQGCIDNLMIGERV